MGIRIIIRIIHSVHSNKIAFKIVLKRECWRIQGLSKISTWLVHY